MPPLSRWFVRAALGYLVAGFTLGAAMLIAKASGGALGWWALLPAHVEFLFIGWTAQLTMGVAFWILPRFAGGASRGNETLAWLAFALLNAGAVLSGLGPLSGRAAALGRMLEASAAVAFGAHAWQRVKRPSA